MRTFGLEASVPKWFSTLTVLNKLNSQPQDCGLPRVGCAMRLEGFDTFRCFAASAAGKPRNFVKHLFMCRKVQC